MRSGGSRPERRGPGPRQGNAAIVEAAQYCSYVIVDMKTGKDQIPTKLVTSSMLGIVTVVVC